MASNPAIYEVFVNQYLRLVLDISVRQNKDEKKKNTFWIWKPRTSNRIDSWVSFNDGVSGVRVDMKISGLKEVVVEELILLITKKRGK